MPFTISHAIAGIAIHKIQPYKLSLSALIIGSIMPDAEYLLRMKMYGIYGHTLPGIFLFDLPLGILIYYLFQKIIKYPLIINSPSFLRRRFIPFLSPKNTLQKRSLQHSMSIIISVFIGIITHVIWDDFTHSTGYFVELFPLLQQDISFFKHSFPLYKLLQQLSSIIGLLAIFLYIFFLPKVTTSLLAPASQRYQCLFLTIFAAIMGIRLAWNFTSQHGSLLVIMLSAFFLSLFITASIWQYQNRKLSEYFQNSL